MLHCGNKLGCIQGLNKALKSIVSYISFLTLLRFTSLFVTAFTVVTALITLLSFCVSHANTRIHHPLKFLFYQCVSTSGQGDQGIAANIARLKLLAYPIKFEVVPSWLMAPRSQTRRRIVQLCIRKVKHKTLQILKDEEKLWRVTTHLLPRSSIK